MAEGSKYNGSSEPTLSGAGRVTSPFVWTEDDEESLRVLKLAGALGIFMLLAYLAYDQQALGKYAPGTDPHWFILAATCLLFGLSWTQSFKRHWKFWILLYNLILIATFMLISRETGDPESRFIAIMLCPLATAAFVSWGARWQFAMAVTAVLGYAAGEHFVPIGTAVQDVPLDRPHRRGDLRSIHLDLYRALPPASQETGAGPRGSGAVSADANRDDGA